MGIARNNPQMFSVGHSIHPPATFVWLPRKHGAQALADIGVSVNGMARISTETGPGSPCQFLPRGLDNCAAVPNAGTGDSTATLGVQAGFTNSVISCDVRGSHYSLDLLEQFVRSDGLGQIVIHA